MCGPHSFHPPSTYLLLLIKVPSLVSGWTCPLWGTLHSQSAAYPLPSALAIQGGKQLIRSV